MNRTIPVKSYVRHIGKSPAYLALHAALRGEPKPRIRVKAVSRYQAKEVADSREQLERIKETF